MRYLDFSTPKSVMRSIFFEFLISVGCVWEGGRGKEERERKMEVGIIIVLLSAGEGEAKNSIE